MTTIETESRAVPQRWSLLGLAVDIVNQGREYASTFLTEFGVMASQILVYKLAAHYLGKEGFSEYALVRRTVSLLQPAVMLGLGVGLPRYIALAEGGGDYRRAARYVGVTIQCIGVVTAVLVAALLAARDMFAYLFFGKAEYRFLVSPLALMLVGIALHSIAYAYFRGRLAMSRANILNLVNLGIAPLLVFLGLHQSISSLLWAMGAAWTSISLLAFWIVPSHCALINNKQERLELLRYGVQRVPGDFALMGLLAFPAFLAAHASGIELAGYVAFGTSITSMIASMFAPIGIVLLPKISRDLGQRNIAKIRKEMALIGWSTAGLSLVLVLCTEFFGSSVIRLYLGVGFSGAMHAVNVVVLGAVPLALYCALRSAIDALDSKAINTINVAIGLISFLLMSGMSRLTQSLTQGVLWSFVTSMFLLAFLTICQSQRILRREAISDSQLGTSFAGGEVILDQ